MSPRVLRWSCEIDDQDHTLQMPPGPVVRVSGADVSRVEFWAVGPADKAFWDAPIGTALPAGVDGPGRTFRVFGTGQPIPDRYVHRGTTERTAHGLVWHLFERADPDEVPAELIAQLRRIVRGPGAGNVVQVLGDTVASGG